MNATASKRVSAHPIPPDALDDRLAFVGTTGSGKTYNAGTAVERLLASGARVVIPDPLGVWWGLRSSADGKSPAYPVVIFGGEHADLPLTENAGALIGEAAATMTESCIVDLTGLGTKAAERRFMLAFLTALYRKTPGDPLHLVFDEADMWAPQDKGSGDKDGEPAKLLGMMETIVRRGRIKGFIPWLITQRPAVLNKNVLSQADGLVAMKLTSSQDRAALGDWIEGQADRVEGKRILGEMPTLQLGQGVVWIPGRGILETAKFPRKETFDSSRTPTRGEAKRTLQLKPLDLDALKGKLEKVEAEIKASDPRALKAEVANLKRQLATAEAKAQAPSPSAQAADSIRAKAFAEGASSRDDEVSGAYRKGFDDAAEKVSRAIATLSAPPAPSPKPVRPAAEVRPLAPPRPPAPPPIATTGDLKPMAAAILAIIHGVRPAPISYRTAAIRAGASIHSSAFRQYAKDIEASGEVETLPDGRMRSTMAGAGGMAGSSLEDWASRLTPSEYSMLRAVAALGPVSREDATTHAGLSITSSGPASALRMLSEMDLIVKQSDGYALNDEVFG